jgi:hypothetical protein
MSYPDAARLELPILQELVATGGADDVRFLYARLVAYFPQMDGGARHEAREDRRWRRHVQRAGRELDEKRQLARRRGQWAITAQGRQRVDEEAPSFSYTPGGGELPAPPVGAELSHADAQQMLIDIGRALGRHAEREFDYYDVVWRDDAQSQRLSHIFEVQRKGNVDAALAKLKRAYESQRSKPFLVVTSERDTNRAQLQLSLARAGAFHEIGRVTTIISFEQLQRLHRALTSVEDLLAEFIAR